MPSAGAFPMGAAVRLADLSVDPYPILRRLHMHEPVSWVPEFQMWFVTSRTDVIAVLTDYKTFTTGGPDSTIRDIFGPQMLTLDGEEHRRFKSGSVATFHPKAICEHAGTVIRANVHALIDGFIRERAADLRTRFANRLSILTIAAILGFPAKDENRIRDWYNAFAGALANFLGDPEIRRCGLNAAHELRDYTMPLLHQFAREPDESLLSSLVHADSDRLSNDEILANALIILFGGIETTESMILNAIWALLTHPEQFQEVVSDRTLLPGAIEESLRWEPAVQSCTRTATDRTTIRDVEINQGDTVQCMLGAANRDPDHFENPDLFDIHRSNAGEHVSFGHARHFCLGAELARLEAQIGLDMLLDRLPGLELDAERTVPPRGHEFRKPPALWVRWK